MKSFNHEYRSGMKQGEVDKLCGGITKACPYKQYPISQLNKYRAWVNGWHKTFRSQP